MGLHTTKIFKVFGWFIIAFALILTLLRFFTPLLTPYITTQIEQSLRAYPYPVHMQNVKVAWQGFAPTLSMDKLEVQSQTLAPLLSAEQIAFSLKVWPLLFKRVQIDTFAIAHLQVNLDYAHSQKRLRVIGIPELQWDLNAASDRTWILPSKGIISHSQIDLHLENDQTLRLETQLWFKAKRTLAQVRAATQFFGTSSAKVTVAADIPLLTSNAIKLYCHWQGDLLGDWIKMIPVTLPLKIDQGRGEIETWLTLKPQHAAEMLTQVKLNDVVLQDIQRNIPFVFKDLTGQFQARKHQDKWELQGHFPSLPLDIALTSDKDDTGRTFDATLKNVDLAPWKNLISHFKPVALQGKVDYLHAKLKYQDEKFDLQLAQVVFSQLTLEPTHDRSGFDALSGEAIMNSTQGALCLHSDKTQVSNLKGYVQPLEFTDLDALLHWQRTVDTTQIKVAQVYTKIADAPVFGKGWLTFAKQSSLPEVDVQLHLGQISTEKALTLFPYEIMDEDLTQWLKTAIQGGTAHTSTLVLRGNLTDFPFDDHSGIFEFATQLEQGQLDYAQGWPILKALKANLLFHNRSLIISGHEGYIDGGKVLATEVIIPDLGADLPMLNVETQLESDLATAVTVINQSPLKPKLSSTLAPFNLSGPMTLSLGLDIPLSYKDKREVKVRGLLELNQSQVIMPEWNVTLPNLVGAISFTEDSVKADKLVGKLLDMPATFSIDSGLSNEWTVKAQGIMGMDKLLPWLNLEIPIVTGQTDYTADLVVSTATQQSSLHVTSSLQGIQIQAPKPFAKEASLSVPLEFKMNIEPNELMRIMAKYGDNVNVTYCLNKAARGWQSVGGHLHFGESRLAKFREDQVFLIDGNIGEIDFKEWKVFLAPKLSTALMTIEPLVELKVDALTLFGAQFQNTQVEAQWDEKTHLWNFNIEGPNIQGHVKYTQKEDKADIIVDLKKLILTERLDFSEYLSDNDSAINKNIYDVKIKEFVMDKKVFKDLQARIEPYWRGFYFPKVHGKIKDTTFNVSGQWDYLSPLKQVKAEGKITTKNIAEVLAVFGRQGSLHGAKGVIDFSVQWNGSPLKVDYASLTGFAEFNLNHGVIQGVNPGAGRVLSLLNIDNVRRRLNLDFSDVTKKGLAFDELEGKFLFGKGKISANKVLLKGTSAKIEAFGQADIENQGLSGEMIVMPNVTGSLPIAAAIAAGNPAVGVGVWVFDKMFGNKIQEINRFRYQVKGTWQTPQVVEIPINKSRG